MAWASVVAQWWRIRLQCRRHGFIPCWEDPLGEEMAPTPVFSPAESHGQRSLVSYSPQGRKRVGHDLATKQQQLCTWLLALGPSSSWVVRLHVSRKSPAFWKRMGPAILAGPKGESVSSRGLWLKFLWGFGTKQNKTKNYILKGLECQSKLNLKHRLLLFL